MPPLGTREYEKGPRGKGPLGELKDELRSNLSGLLARAWQIQADEGVKPSKLMKVETPKLYTHKNAGGLLVSAWAEGGVFPDGNVTVAEIFTQDVMQEDQGFAIEGPAEALIQIVNHNEKVIIRDNKWTRENSLTYKGEMDLVQDALVTVNGIDRLF